MGAIQIDLLLLLLLLLQGGHISDPPHFVIYRPISLNFNVNAIDENWCSLKKKCFAATLASEVIATI